MVEYLYEHEICEAFRVPAGLLNTQFDLCNLNF